MAKQFPQIGPREDFPVRRLIEKIILGNMVFTGGFFLLGSTVELLGDFFGGYFDSPRELLESVYQNFTGFVSTLRYRPEFTALMLVFGTFCGVVWYWIARHLETRRLKKRFGILTKSCTSPTPDVKSPHS